MDSLSTTLRNQKTSERILPTVCTSNACSSLISECREELSSALARVTLSLCTSPAPPLLCCFRTRAEQDSERGDECAACGVGLGCATPR
eukprot:1010436-Rhodomonas_salina.2